MARHVKFQLNDAQRSLVEANIMLAYKYVGRYYSQRDARVDDMIQEAMWAMCRAAYHFDASKGFAFSTFAYGSINMHFRRLHYEEEERDTKKTWANTVTSGLVYAHGAGEGDDLTLYEKGLNATAMAETPMDEKVITHVEAQEIFASLDDRERSIVTLCAQGLSQTAVGKQVGLSQAQVSRTKEGWVMKSVDWIKHNVCSGCRQDRYNMGRGYAERPGIDAPVMCDHCWHIPNAIVYSRSKKRWYCTASDKESHWDLREHDAKVRKRRELLLQRQLDALRRSR
jgi:RNA polymerase sigma factor (sigma-70 family)